ncbi:15082_t:CDS:2, partial [Acaulospora colombiana]
PKSPLEVAETEGISSSESTNQIILFLLSSPMMVALDRISGVATHQVKPGYGTEAEESQVEPYPAKSLTHLVLHGQIPFEVLRDVQFPVLQEINQMNLEHVPCLRLECQPGIHFWDLGKGFEYSQSFRDEIIPGIFSKLGNLRTVYATGCIWKTFAWIFDAWSLEFEVASTKKCQEFHAISMEKVRDAMEGKVPEDGEGWIQSLYPDDEYGNDMGEYLSKETSS